jgi:hypothetical protein
MIARSFSFLSVALMVGASAVATLRAVPANNAESPAPVVLSPYEVSANSVDFEHWIKVGSPHFTIYTDTSLEDATRIVGEFEMLHLAAAKYLQRQTFKRPPTIVVLPTARSDWRKLEATAAVEWHVAVSQPIRRLMGLVVVQYNWEGWLVGDNVVLASLGKAQLEDMKLGGPLWFGYGMGSFFETARFDGNTVVLGKQTARSRTMWMHGWLPWDAFFRATTTSPEFTKSSGITKFTGQAAAFVHYVLTNPDPVWRERMMDWVARLQAGHEPTEQEFKEVFGQDWESWQKTIKAHVANRRDHPPVIELTAEEMNFPRTKFELPVREMRELFVLAQILNQKIPASEIALDALLAKGVKTESFRELLVEACVKFKRNDAAQAQLQAMVDARSENPAVYVAIAEDRFRSRVPRITLQAQLGDGAAEIRALCRKALELEPFFPEAHNLLAWTEALSPPVEPENIAVIETSEHALNGIVSTTEIVSALAIAQWRKGNPEAARALSQKLLASPYANKKSKDLATALLAELGPAP